MCELANVWLHKVSIPLIVHRQTFPNLTPEVPVEVLGTILVEVDVFCPILVNLENFCCFVALRRLLQHPMDADYVLFW